MKYADYRAELVARGRLREKWESTVGGPTDHPRALGTVTDRGWTEDKDGLWEHRERLSTIAQCPRCGCDVECLADTDGWKAAAGSRVHRHTSYGPDMGECCDLLLADTDFEGGFAAFDLSVAGKKE